MGTTRQTTLQAITVEFTVTEALDGTTPAPPVIIDQGAPDATAFDRLSQVYRAPPVARLGLIDPDLLLGGSIGPRCIPFVTLDTTATGAPGASADLVAVRLGGPPEEVVFQRQLADLGGLSGPLYAEEGFNIAQGSALRVGGFTAPGGEPIRLRISILVPTSCRDIVAFRPPPPNGNGNLLLGTFPDFSVNAAGVDGPFGDRSIVLRTGDRPNPAGAFGGTGAGNKSIFGVPGLAGLKIGNLQTIEYVWENLLGPGGPFIPPGGPSVLSPYLNLIVDFDPLGAGDVRVLSLVDDSLAAAITASIGTYVNNGSDQMTYSWDGSTQNVLFVGLEPVPPALAPGGVAAEVSVGVLWPENSYDWQALVAANPDAVLVEAFTGDGGLPAGSITSAMLLVSSDSVTATKSGKHILSLSVNGTNVLA